MGLWRTVPFRMAWELNISKEMYVPGCSQQTQLLPLALPWVLPLISVVPPSTELFTTLKKMVPGMTVLELDVWGWEEMARLVRSPDWALCALRGREHCTKGHRPDPFYLLSCPQGTPFQRISSSQCSPADSGGSQR